MIYVFICIIYLHIIDVSLKAMIAMFFIFAIRKALLLLFKSQKEMCCKKINPYFFDVVRNGQMFPSILCHFQYDIRLFLVEKWEILEVARKHDRKNLLNIALSRWYSFWYFSSCLKIKIIQGELLLPICCTMF